MIQFDPERHEYRDEEGIVVPSVTKVIRMAGLMGDYWKADEAAMVRGTYVHRAVEMLLVGTLDEEDLDPVLQPYISAFKLFMRDTKLKALKVEQRVFSRVHRFAGTLDLLATFNGDPRFPRLIDIKSGAMPDWAAIQTAAYKLAGSYRVVRRHGLELRPNGTYGLYDFADDLRDTSVFLGALAVTKWKQEKGIP